MQVTDPVELVIETVGLGPEGPTPKLVPVTVTVPPDHEPCDVDPGFSGLPT